MYKFYIKAVGGEFSIYHSLTHTFVESLKTELKLKVALKKWNEKSDEELWIFLLEKRMARIPKKGFEGKDKFFSDNDAQYEEAWKIFTERFFSRHKSLGIKQEEIPYELIQTLQRQREVAQKQQMERERAEAEERMKKFEVETKVEKQEEKEDEKLLKKVPEGARKKFKVKRVKGFGKVVLPSL